MTERTTLVTADDAHFLRSAISLNMQLPVEEVSFLNGAVIAIARAGGGAGADTLAALLTYCAGQCGYPIALVDFSAEGDEGPAWDNTHSQYWCARVTISNELGAELGDIITENSRGLVIINTPANTLPDLVSAERDYVPIIKLLEKPYYLIWIDRPMDQQLDRIGGYRKAGGEAHCIIAAVESETLRADLEVLSVRMPLDITHPVTIPRLPLRIAEGFYKNRTILRDAITMASAGSQATFFRKLKAFVADLRKAL